LEAIEQIDVEIDEMHDQIHNSWSNATFWRVRLSEFSKVGDLCFLSEWMKVKKITLGKFSCFYIVFCLDNAQSR
jgi:hypothetical protein